MDKRGPLMRKVTGEYMCACMRELCALEEVYIYIYMTVCVDVRKECQGKLRAWN